MKVLIAIFSYNRPNLLKFTTRYLWKYGASPDDTRIFDDDSDDPGVLGYLEHCREKGCSVWNIGERDPISRKYLRDRAMRLAVLRQAAVDVFLSGIQADYLFFKDDDVLTNWSAIQEAVTDFEQLKRTDWAKIGALTLHGISTHKGFIQVDGKVFAELSITGEANVLFSREALLKVGNHFAPVSKGFADTQFEALRAGGYKYYDRVWPTYNVQHLGFGPLSSTVHQDEANPSWTLGPYTCTYTRRDFGEPLRVPGFDVQAFAEAAIRVGAEKAIQEIPR